MTGRELILKTVLECDDIEQLREINHLVCQKMDILQQMRALSFEVGQKVSWHSKKQKREMMGTITKVGKKRLTVLTTSGITWTLPAGMATVIKK
jgi:hypothetical protein